MARHARQRLAVGLSGGGDSLALLHALRATYPKAEVAALIVDHGLRKASRAEAEQAADWARQAGAEPQILTWTSPRSGQGRARQARHRLLAETCHEYCYDLLCLGHTLDDRIETLRMRQARSGPRERMAGPSLYDPSPVWPDGRFVTIARPFQRLRRRQLRAYLEALGQPWLEDPSNDDARFERVRVRQDAYEEGSGNETRLLQLSDQIQTELTANRYAACALMEAGVEMAPWGGFLLDPEVFVDAPIESVRPLLEALVLAASGKTELPSIDYHALHTAIWTRTSFSGGGILLTEEGWLARDPGAVLGRADGTPGIKPVTLQPSERALFDGRWEASATRPITFGPWGRAESRTLDAWDRNHRRAVRAPDVFKPSLLAANDAETGEFLAVAGVNYASAVGFELLAERRIASRLLPPPVPTWFDAEECARNVEARLAKPDSKSNITV